MENQDILRRIIIAIRGYFILERAHQNGMPENRRAEEIRRMHAHLQQIIAESSNYNYNPNSRLSAYLQYAMQIVERLSNELATYDENNRTGI
ncbi:unnamed protein product [Caenorhabditis bovis]|uniref:Uncharacterized protein n=1 Tax=Caenorhabditis bovis TaxID=2654633 RepID=A0A8S1FCH6_9PELO|nr:unnamed protein product [Caenorhabditis bovis]